MSTEEKAEACINQLQNVNEFMRNTERWAGLPKETRLQFIQEIGTLQILYQECLFTNPKTDQ